MTTPPPPQELRALTDLIGVEAAVLLIELHGGVPISVPMKAEGSRLATDIGLDAARKLSERYGREKFKPPLCKNWRARYYRAQGLSLNAIARKLGCHQSTVAAILRGDPARGSQQLFLELPPV